MLDELEVGWMAGGDTLAVFFHNCSFSDCLVLHTHHGHPIGEVLWHLIKVAIETLEAFTAMELKASGFAVRH